MPPTQSAFNDGIESNDSVSMFLVMGLVVGLFLGFVVGLFLGLFSVLGLVLVMVPSAVLFLLLSVFLILVQDNELKFLISKPHLFFSSLFWLSRHQDLYIEIEEAILQESQKQKEPLLDHEIFRLRRGLFVSIVIIEVERALNILGIFI
jgi:ABC-type dipeptide/oligopeptide/nickel transport system permease subunit